MDLPDFPDRWQVSDPELIAETFSSRVWRVRRADGTIAVVKSLKPFDDVEDELRGAHLLEWRDGEGMVKLLGFDGRQMLLEDAGERMLVDELNEQGDAAATEIAAEVMARLHSPSKRPPPPALQPLEERFRDLFARAKIDRDADASSLYVDAADIAEQLLANPHDVRPLHGDLHHENILCGPRGWLAIDPKGVMGDPGFDAANLFYNPLGRDELCLAPERIAAMADVLGRTLKQDFGTILDHAFAYGCLSAAWHWGDDNSKDEDRQLSIAAAIRAVRLTS